MASPPLDKRAVNAVLSDELELQKGTDELIKVKLEDGELFRIFYDSDSKIWILTHALPKTRRYFPDFDSHDKQAIIDIVNEYPIKSISLKNDHPVYSKDRLITRMKQLSRFGKKKMSEEKYLRSLM